MKANADNFSVPVLSEGTYGLVGDNKGLSKIRICHSITSQLTANTMVSLKTTIAERILTFALCLFIYYPFFLFGAIMIYLTRIVNKLKKITGFGYKAHGKLGKISRKHVIHDVVEVSTDEELDFLRHRSPSYLYRMSVWTARELSKLLLHGQTVGLISEQDLAYSILNSVFAHSLTWDEPSQMYRMKMKGFDDFFLFRGFYWDAREVWVNKDCTKMKVILTDGRVRTWPCPKEDLPEWKLAKLHAQVCMTYYAPGLSHNHVHFVFPSSITLTAKRTLKPNSFLYRLLKPHFCFTERINYQALNVGKATNNKRSALDRHFFFWQPIPITVEQFVEGVAKKCHKYYYVNYQKHVKKRENNPDLPQHCNFPPPYVSNKKLQEIPYLYFLASYYEVIRSFVTSVSDHIDKSEWYKMVNVLANYVPGIENADMIDVLSTFIHQVGVVHYCDHETFLSFFGRQYGCMCIRSPYEPWSNTDHWKNVVGDDPRVQKTKQYKENPLLLLCRRDIMRTRCFQNVFVDFIDDWSLDLRLATTVYNFHPSAEMEAVECVDRFKRDLKNLDARLAQMQPPIVIPPVPASDIDLNLKGSTGQGVYGRAPNMQLIPVKNIIRAVCF